MDGFGIEDNPKRNKRRILSRLTPRYTIGVRFITFVVLTAIVAVCSVSFITINNSYETNRQSILQNSLITADLTDSFISQYILALESHLRVFALRPDVQQFLTTRDSSQIQQALIDLITIQNVLNGVGLYDSSGRQIAHNDPDATTIGQSFTDRVWFQKVVATRKPYLDQPIVSRVNNMQIVAYAVPIFDKAGQIQAILTAGISLNKLSDIIEHLTYNSDYRITILDLNTGAIVADTDKKYISTTLTGYDDIIKKLSAGEHGSIITQTGNGETAYIGFSSHSDIPWGVVVINSGKTALAQTGSMIQNALIVLGIILILIIIAGILLVFGITHPLRKLVEDTEIISGGNLNYTAIKRNDEIGELSSAFALMTAKLKHTTVSRDELQAEVNERKKAEESLQETLQKLERSNEELQRFAYVASHDLQEPLRMVSSYVQLLERRYKNRLDADANEFIDFAVDGVNRMQHLLNDLLTYSRVSSKAKSLAQTDMNRILEIAVLNLKVAIEESKAQITHDQLPIIMADEVQMSQVLQNLIGNAIKFSGGKTPVIHISSKRGTKEWFFSVKDNGIGIESQYFDRIFIIFQRLHGFDYPGSGTGLAIVKRIVERHGGRIWVESEFGKYSIFHFTIPVGGKQ
jgi:signal transduction histidine kinase